MNLKFLAVPAIMAVAVFGMVVDALPINHPSDGPNDPTIIDGVKHYNFTAVRWEPFDFTVYDVPIPKSGVSMVVVGDNFVLNSPYWVEDQKIDNNTFRFYGTPMSFGEHNITIGSTSMMGQPGQVTAIVTITVTESGTIPPEDTIVIPSVWDDILELFFTFEFSIPVLIGFMITALMIRRAREKRGAR